MLVLYVAEEYSDIVQSASRLSCVGLQFGKLSAQILQLVSKFALALRSQNFIEVHFPFVFCFPQRYIFLRRKRF